MLLIQLTRMKSLILFAWCTFSLTINVFSQSRQTNIDTNLSAPSLDTNLLVHNVSLIQLIATPERYHQKIVQVVGYLNLEFEGNAVYLHKEDFDNVLSNNGIWVIFSDLVSREKKLTDYSKKYVILQGTFDMYKKGHFGLYSGTIRNITRLDNWISR